MVTEEFTPVKKKNNLFKSLACDLGTLFRTIRHALLQMQ